MKNYMKLGKSEQKHTKKLPKIKKKSPKIMKNY